MKRRVPLYRVWASTEGTGKVHYEFPSQATAEKWARVFRSYGRQVAPIERHKEDPAWAKVATRMTRDQLGLERYAAWPSHIERDPVDLDPHGLSRLGPVLTRSMIRRHRERLTGHGRTR
jgi:hypothetical protein